MGGSHCFPMGIMLRTVQAGVMYSLVTYPRSSKARKHIPESPFLSSPPLPHHFPPSPFTFYLQARSPQNFRWKALLAILLLNLFPNIYIGIETPLTARFMMATVVNTDLAPLDSNHPLTNSLITRLSAAFTEFIVTKAGAAWLGWQSIT